MAQERGKIIKGYKKPGGLEGREEFTVLDKDGLSYVVNLREIPSAISEAYVAETDTTLVLAPDGNNKTQWIPITESLITDLDKYTQAEVDALIGGIESFQIASTSGNSIAGFGNNGLNEYLTISTYDGVSSSLNVAQSGIRGNTTGIKFGLGADTGFNEASANTIAVLVGGTTVGTFTSIGYAGFVGDTGRALVYYNPPSSTIPGFTFIGNTNTGVGRASSDQLSFIAGGIEGLRIDGATAPGFARTIINPDGAVGVNTGIWFGNGSTGIYPQSEANLYIHVLGSHSYTISSVGIAGVVSQASFLLRNITTSDTVPTLIPNALYIDTGLGRPNIGGLSLIVSGVEGIRVNSAAAHSVAGILNYETLVIADDDLPNKKYVDDAISASGGTQVIVESTSTLSWAGFGNGGAEEFITLSSGLGAGSGNIVTVINGDTTNVLSITADGEITSAYGRYLYTNANGNIFVGLSGPTSVSGGAIQNVSIGTQSSNDLTGGDYNVSIGYRSNYNITTSSYNTALGSYSGYTNITGSDNIFLGAYAGYYETGGNKLYISSLTNIEQATEADGRVRAIIYGEQSAITADQNLYFNSDVHTPYRLYVGATVPVDNSHKVEIQALSTSPDPTLNMLMLYADATSVGGATSASVSFTLADNRASITAGPTDVLSLGAASTIDRLIIGTDGSLTAINVYNDTVGGTNRDLFIDNTGLIGYVSSSLRYKKNIESMEFNPNYWNLRPVKFNYISDPSIDQIGLIAEEVEAQGFLELCDYNKYGEIETVQYSKSPVLNMLAIQNIHERLTQVETNLGL
jgi:hypothetical protein